MNTVSNVSQVRELVTQWRQSGERIALVPTMGNLHQGHLQLVNVAKQLAERVVVSIFINPTQFGVGEDFDNYPRTRQADHDQLRALDVDIVFEPNIDDVYAPNASTFVSIRDLSQLHCGVFRPGHFDGVATIVCKLFNIVQADIACFGLKDFQQLSIIRKMVRDLFIPIEIVAVETVRESSGLALSSRNLYLSADEKSKACLIYQLLCQAKDQLLEGQSIQVVQSNALVELNRAGFTVDYFSINGYHDLQSANEHDNELIILVAARLGKTRLIDNIAVKR